MRDIIWTIIVIWLVWKIYNLFKSTSQKRTNHNQTTTKQHKEGETFINYTNSQKTTYNPKDAEYVDYEEIKE
ncbi:MAG: hypothetical protein IT237_10555 [Bacteroidia bacterium]|nr:hypothetical protein [Bacteroidia bacterium]